MDDNDMEREFRRQRRLERLGCNDPHCGMCGENDDRALEAHHVAGRKHDPATVILCRNCHRKVSDDQRDRPPFEADTDPLLYAIGSFLLGLADMLRIVLAKLNEFGLALMARAAVIEGGAA